MNESLPLLLCSLALAGCAPSPIGTWRVDDSYPHEMACEGLDAERAEYWFTAMTAETFSDAYIAQGDDEDPQLQLTRSDGTVVYADMARQGERLFRGLRSDAGVDVGQAGLGGDFSVLLEGDALGCRFNMDTELNLRLDDEDGREVMHAIVELGFSPSATLDSCDFVSCAGRFDALGVRHGFQDPGTWPPTDGE